jgi:BirA family biotin operon repressor/biotin-[acetyl-CoA-carboxylase] ligase
MTEPYRSGQWLIFTEDSVASTQKWVKERILSISNHSVILASAQTMGRGRSGREWCSPAGGFYASFLLKPSPPMSFAPCVSLYAAVVVARLLKRAGIPSHVKWPNDVIVQGKKIAGIIAETGSFPESWFILGIGVNLTETPALPERKFLPAGSWAEFAPPPSAHNLLEDFLMEFDSNWKNRTDNPLAGAAADLREILWRRGKQVTLTAGDETVQGIIRQVDNNGSLVMITDGGERRFSSGELLTFAGDGGEHD